MSMHMENSCQSLKGAVQSYFLRNRALRIVLLPVILLMILSNCFEILLPACRSKIVKSFELRDGNMFCIVILKLVGITALHYAAAFGYRYLFKSQIYGMKAQFLEQCLSFYLNMNYGEYHSLGTGRVAVLVQKECYALIKIIDILVLDVGYSSIFFIICIATIFKDFYYKWMALFVATLVISLIYIWLSARTISSLRREVTQKENVSSNKLFDILRNFEIVKSFNNEPKELSKYSFSLRHYIFSGTDYNRIVEILSLCFRIMLYIPFVIGAVMCFCYGMSLEYYVCFSGHMSNFKKRISKIRDISSEVINYSADVTTSEAIVLEPGNKPHSGARNAEIIFQEVSLPGRRDSLLHPFELKILRGEKIAITGRNGAGKSTFLKTLLGFGKYKGRILLNGEDISCISQSSLRSMIAYVPQQSHIMDSTIWDNLMYGSSWSADEMIRLSKHCGMHDIITALPHGYETRVGEAGRLLSGGQCQMLNFMRAVAKDAPLILLDEPTSSLDHTASRELISLIMEILSDKTVLLTTHNPEFLSRFDRIINIRDGQVLIYNNASEFIQNAAESI